MLAQQQQSDAAILGTSVHEHGLFTFSDMPSVVCTQG